MSQNFPADRTLVDDQKKIVDPWLGPLKRLAPLLTLTNEDFTALKALIAASRTTDDTGEIADPFELEIDEDPVFSEDYVIGWRTALTAARRFPLTLFATPTLINTTSLAGASSADITLPAGYRDIRLRLKGASSTSGSPVLQIAFSEDGGSTFVNQAWWLTRNGADTANTNSTPGQMNVAAVSNTLAYFGRIDLWDYTSSTNKYVEEHGFACLVASTYDLAIGSRLISSTAPITTVRFSVSAGGGNFDAGSVELWGIP